MTTLLNDSAISSLIAARSRITNVRDEQIDFAAVDDIDKVLAQVEPGQRNDVDLLLGRPTARLAARVVARIEEEERREGWIVPPTVTVEEVGPIIAAKMAEYHLTHQPTTGDTVNDSLIAAANEHNVKAFEWRRAHPDWRTQR